MRKHLAGYALAAIILALVPQILWASGAQCTKLNATLHGTYVVSGGGTIIGVGPVTALGEHTWDGQGATVAHNTISANGNVFPATVTGTYTINADCTGTLAESDGSHYNLVVSPDGNTLSWIDTDPGTVLSGTEVRLRPLSDENTDRATSRK